MNRFSTAVLLCLFAPLLSLADAWPMKQRDMYKTGRADFIVPAARQNDTFFDILRWQTRSPGSPNEGNFSSSAIVFFDGVGPGGADLAVSGYHWPKGVQGMDRHTGQRFWYGNPSGGESIGALIPAFSGDGATVYVTNDASPHPAMAFHGAVGPSVFWHNGGDPDPGILGSYSPTIAPDGRIFLNAWHDRPHAATDLGTALTHTWSAATALGSCFNEPALEDTGGQLRVVTAGRWGIVACFDGTTGAERWSQSTGIGTDACPTIDPATGHIYVPAGGNSIYIVGLDRDGWPLWGPYPEVLVYEWLDGLNDPERAVGTGCLSHDGATYYFQTVGPQKNGRLYAIRTVDGSVKWTFDTGAGGWELWSSCPIVTPNGVLVVGNCNAGGTYFALRDDGAHATLLDTLVTAGTAKATATLSADGLLYLPVRMPWLASNGSGEIPTFEIENVYTCFDLNAGATTQLPPPPGQLAIALDQAVALAWKPILDPTGQFDHYAIYRATAPFTSVSGRTPIATVHDLNATAYTDTTVTNGVSYYYAVTTVSLGGGEVDAVQATGPRTPHAETDLQIACLSRLPRYPRYLPNYTYYWVTEPSGFGPYLFSAATSLGGGQTEQTPRWPEIGDPVTYVATVRNAGTTVWSGTLAGTWRRAGVVVATPSRPVTLAPYETTTFEYTDTWNDALYELDFTLNLTDADAYNNSRTIQTKSVPFLTYLDITFVENFREISTPMYPQAATHDALDWLQRHLDTMNRMFAEAGSLKRVHYDVLETLRDGDDLPPLDRTPFGIFPLRYPADFPDGNPRGGYYHPDEDIDYGLCHELAHQLGLIDIYVFNISGDVNRVSSLPYSPPADLMLGCSPLFSPFSARAMDRWIDIVHGYYGQFMYDIPSQVRLRILDFYGNPLPGATVTVYQYCDHPDGRYIGTQPKAQGVTDGSGIYTLPNVPIDPQMVPPTDAGVLHDNPFGYVAVVGTNALLHFKIEYQGFVDYAWLSLPDVNLAYWAGQTAQATFDRQTFIGGPAQNYPPGDLAELNAANWTGFAQGGTCTLVDDTGHRKVGAGSIRFQTDGGADNFLRYPVGLLAHWNLSQVTSIRFWAYADNPNLGFQNQSPWVRLGNYSAGYFQWTPSWDILNQARNQWREFIVPIAGNATWSRAAFGTPSLSEVNYFELHADTWDAGFTLWLDGVRFEPAPLALGDMNCDGFVNFDDIDPFVIILAGGTPCRPANADVNQDGTVDFEDIDPFVIILATGGG